MTRGLQISNPWIVQSSSLPLKKKTIFYDATIDLVATTHVYCRCHLLSHFHNFRFAEKIESCLGFDWLLAFMQENLHWSTVTKALHLLITSLICAFSSSSAPTPSAASSNVPGASNFHVLDRFRIGEHFGGWLHGTETLQDRKEDSLLGRSLVCFFNLYLHVCERQRLPLLYKRLPSEVAFLHTTFNLLQTTLVDPTHSYSMPQIFLKQEGELFVPEN